MCLKKEESDEFMQIIDVYDVASKTWYKQAAEGGPSGRTRGCAVLAPAQDLSSFNIYYYGGYAGRNIDNEASDEVWVLSIPSFTWTKLSEGRPDYGRMGHKCFMPYPDQMMIIGGMPTRTFGNIPCHMGGLIQVFNLTSGDWMEGYDPDEHADYGVPDAVRSVIGGDPTGGATLTTPSPSGWTNDSLGDIFQTAYETSKITTWYPYEKAPEDTGRPTIGDGDGDEEGGGGGGLPTWVAPVLGVVLGLVFLTALLVAFCLWRRRRILRGEGYTEPSTDDNGTRILSWIRGQPAEHKALTVTTTEDTPSNAEMAEVRSTASPVPQPAVAPRFEMMDTAIAELPGMF